MRLRFQLVVCSALDSKGVDRGTRAAGEMFVKTVCCDDMIVIADGMQGWGSWRLRDDEPCTKQFSIKGTGEKVGPVGCLQVAYESSNADILALIHDDVVIHEPGWDARVLREFSDPTIGVVGFGGATGLADDDIYRTPYRLQQLARHGYASNVDDAEVHGERFAGEKDVAVLDGFCLIVRRELLDKMGGWPTQHLKFHMYDAALACYAKRFGYRTRLVGVRCHHHGGQTSCRTEYHEWLKREFNTTDAEVHRVAHEWIASEFRDVLPIRV